LLIATVGLEKNKFATVPGGGAGRSKIFCHSGCITTDERRSGVASHLPSGRTIDMTNIKTS
jgi:hypothetical protein